jgi:hypothetical protein
MDIGKSFSFVFEDKEWVTKILIAMLIMLLGVLFSWLVIPAILAALLFSGYGLEITRRVLRGESDLLPAWDNWGKLFTDGLMVLIIGIVYALPMIVVWLCLGIPLGAVSDNSDSAAAVVSSLLGCLNLLWSIVLSFLLPPAIAIFAKEGELSAAFRFGEVVALVRDHFTTYLITAVMVWVANLIGGLGLLLCGIGWLFTTPYASFVTSHLYGQAYVEAAGLVPQPAVEIESV